MDIKISCIVPIYKVERYLNKCISSIRFQTLEDIEIILIDEGLDDECYSIMKYHQKLDKRIKIIHEKNGSYGIACNKGFDISRGRYISIVESDDYIDENMFSDLYKVAIENDLDIVKCGFYNLYDEINHGYKIEYPDYLLYLIKNIPYGIFNPMENTSLFSVHPSIWSSLYKIDLIRDIRFSNIKNSSYEDSYFRLQTLMKSKRVIWIPKPYYYYRQTNVNASSFGGNYNITKMIKRWEECLAIINNQDISIKNKILTALVPEMWPMLFSNCYDKINSKDWYNNCRHLFKNFDKEIIINGPDQNRLPSDYKKKILSILTSKNYEQWISGFPFPEKIKFTRLYKILRIFQFYILFRANIINFHFLCNLKETLFSFHTSILNYFNFYFRIGK